MTELLPADALKEIMNGWATADPPWPLASPVPADYALRVLDKVQEITGERSAILDAELRGIPSAAALAAVAELERRVRWTRDYALNQALEARQAQDTARAGEAARAAWALSQGLFDDENFATSLIQLGMAARDRGDTFTGLKLYEEAGALAEEHGWPGILSAALDDIGRSKASLGDLDAAVTAFRDSDHYARQAGDPASAVVIAQNWALALAAAGRLREASARLQSAADQNLVGVPLPALLRAILLDNLASLALQLGDVDRAGMLIGQAQPLFDALPSKLDRGRYAENRAAWKHQLGDRSGEAAAFIEAHDLILAYWQADADAGRYSAAFRATLEAPPTPLSADLEQQLQPGLDLLNAGKPEQAIGPLKAVYGFATVAGDQLVAARAALHAGMALREAGQIDGAQEWLRTAATQAHESGNARLEGQALWNLRLLGQDSGEIGDDLTGLSGLIHVLALQELLPAVADAAGLKGLARENYLGGRGFPQDELGREAAQHGADDLARAYFAESLRFSAATPGNPREAFARANRLANKVVALPSDATADNLAELERLAATWAQDYRVVMTSRRALGLHELHGGRLAQAAVQLRACCEAGEAIRRTLTAAQRAEAGAAFTGPWPALVDCCAQLDDADGAVQASQAAKGRHIADVLDARAGALGDGAPLAVSEIRQRLAEVSYPAGTSLVDVFTVRGFLVLTVISADVATVCTLLLPGNERWGARIQQTAAMDGPLGLVRMVASDPVLAALAAEVESLVPAGAPVLACLDPVLQELPVHALVVGGQPWCDRNPWSLLPAVGLLRHISGEPRPRRGLSFVGGDSRGDLPGARAECCAVAQEIGVTPMLGPDCTLSALHDTIAHGPLDVLHLAVHGLGDRARGRYSGLIMADDHQQPILVPFEQLAADGLPADLVVLSGCSTAVSGPLHRSRMAGVAIAAIESGATSVVGCQWPVDDVAAEVFMKAFYGRLVQTWDDAPVDLRTCMAAGRDAVRRWTDSPAEPAGHARDGTREMPLDSAAPGNAPPDPATASALAWAPFILIGDPVLFG
jgi:CHAT domain-containing protein/tetratricopeptide (TPR) repeat protein